MKCKLEFTQNAVLKMDSLINYYESEVGWHGTVRKLATGHYLVDDILVYPQLVTAATVKSDPDKYPMWLMNQPDEVFNNLRLHGHSHVNMGCWPSSTDERDQETVLRQMPNDGFYIFIICNKRNEYWAKVIDRDDKEVYEPEEVDFLIQGFDTEAFLTDADSLVERPPTGYQRMLQQLLAYREEVSA